MRYASIGKQPRREVNIPELSGGMNLRDSVSMINDNQMTDCQNMWFKTSMLRTRPPFKTSHAMVNNIGRKDINEKFTTRLHPEVTCFYKSQECVLVSNKIVNQDNNGKYTIRLNFEFQSENEIFKLPEISDITSDKDATYFVTELNGVLYCYISNFTIYTFDFTKEIELGEDEPAWEKATDGKMYVPTVMAHGQRTGVYEYKGVQFEGYNLLSPRFKVIYSAYNENDSDNTHPMRYNFGTVIAAEGIVEVKLSYIDANGILQTATHTIDASGLEKSSYVSEGIKREDGLCAYIHKEYLGFSENIDSENQPVYKLDSDTKVGKFGNIEDNIVITATAKYSDDEKAKLLNKVFSMTECTWFGGAANGISGGSRLFLCGNTDADNKALVVWSGLNDPLYFGENCNAYVGSKSRAATTFGRQDEKLIIFKENKIYYTYYVQNSDISAENLIDQSVVDYAANSVYFPMITLNGLVGCDCPHTVQMCRNRLVWANSDGKVYTITTLNQYNERSVFDVSQVVSPKLLELRNRLPVATSADWDGHYVLFLGDCALVMDYNSYGYQHVYSYSKKEDANALIPWYFWEFPFISADNEGDMHIGASICSLHNTLVMRAVFNASVESKVSIIAYSMKAEDFEENDKVFINDFENTRLVISSSAIKSVMQTKLFDFSAPNYYKNVDRVNLMLGNNGGVPISVQFVTDAGCEQETVTLTDSELTPFTAGYVSVQSFNPCVRSVQRFGVRLESKGLLAVDGINLLYRLLGGVR